MLKPIVYDRFDTTYSGYGLAILENADEVKVYENLKGDHTLELVLPRTDPKWQYIQTDNFIKVDNQLYIIRSTDEIRDEQGKLTSNIQCEHIFYELLDEWITNYSIFGTAQDCLSDALTGTRFKADALRISGSDIVEDEAGQGLTPIAVVNKIMGQFQCEAQCSGLPDPMDGKFTVSLYSQRGANWGVQFRYKKNLRTVKRTVDARGLTTRLYVYGKDNLGIESVNDGVSYLDSPNINLYPRPKKASATFSDIEDPAELKQKGLDYLSTVDTPKLTYEVSILELREILGDSEKVSVGDTVRTRDEDLNIDVTARVTEYEWWPYKPEQSRVVLSNFIDSVADTLTQLDITKQIVERVMAKGRVNTYWLDGVINTLKNQMVASSSYNNAEVREGQGILLENYDPNDPTNQSGNNGAIYMGPNMLAIASEKNQDGSWNWRTFGTGKGFTADLINAGQINSDLIVIGPNTTYEAGYDPSAAAADAAAANQAAATAQTAANNANTAASNAQTTANNASTAAGNAQSTANVAQTTANNSVQQGASYNSTYIDANGIRVNDGSADRVKLGYIDSTIGYGIKITNGKIVGATVRTAEPAAGSYGYFTELAGGSAITGKWQKPDGTTKTVYNLNSTGNGGTLALYQNGQGAGEIIPYQINGQVWTGPFGYDWDDTFTTHNPNMYGAAVMGSMGGDLLVYNNQNKIESAGNFSVRSGYSKNAEQITQDYGIVYLHANESPDAKFSDEHIAEMIDGVCTVLLDPIFLQCIEPNTDTTPWIITFGAYDAPMMVHVEDIGADYITFNATAYGPFVNNGRFSWRISATRIGFANDRFTQPQTTPINDAMNTGWENTL